MVAACLLAAAMLMFLPWQTAPASDLSDLSRPAPHPAAPTPPTGDLPNDLPNIATAEPWPAGACLDNALALDARGTAFAEVMARIDALAFTTVRVDPRVDVRAALPVTLVVHGMTLRHCLDLLLPPRGLGYLVGRRCITVVRAQDLGDAALGAPPDAESPAKEAAWRKVIADWLDDRYAVACTDGHLVACLLSIRPAWDWDGTSLADIVIDPRVIRADPVLTITANDLKLGDLLYFVTKAGGCRYVIRDGVVFITTRDP